jgi:molybdenum cofactor cytidylyltransferase
MVATIKIIPLAVSGNSLDRAKAAIAAPGLAHLRPFQPVRAGLISTVLPSLKGVGYGQDQWVLEARLALSGSSLVEESRVAHDADAVAGEIVRMASVHEMIIVFGASAVTDSQDVIPAAIWKAGGHVERGGHAG